MRNWVSAAGWTLVDRAGMAVFELLLLRHGIAEEPNPALADADRALTPHGRARTGAVLERLVSLGWVADRLLSSPLVRAWQTAELAVEAGLAATLVREEALAPGGDGLACVARWRQQTMAGGGRLALVGHEPDLGHLACRLLGAPAGVIELRKAGVALLRLEGEGPSGATLRLLLSPRALLG
jgi:phosphohistidine phosphatase